MTILQCFLYLAVFGTLGMVLGDLGGKKNGPLGFLLGSLLGPLGCLIAVLLPPSVKATERSNEQGRIVKLESELADQKRGQSQTAKPFDPLEEFEMEQRVAAGPPPPSIAKPALAADDGRVPTYRLD